MRSAILTMCLLLGACAPHNGPPNCDLGLFFGGDAGTSRCASNSYYEPRYLPAQQLRPYYDAVRELERR